MIVVKLFDYMNSLKTNSLQEKIKCPLLKYFVNIFHLRKKFGWEGGLSGKFKPIKFTLQIYMPWTILANNFILRKPLPPLLINTGSAHDIALNYTPGVVYLATKIKIESLTRAYQTKYSEFLELTIFYQNVCGSFWRHFLPTN